MISSVNFNPNITWHSASKTQDTPISHYDNYDMTSDVSNAHRAYGQAMINYAPMSLDNYVNKLISEGKIEGKDFEIIHKIHRSYVNLLNKDNQADKSLLWEKNGNKEDFVGQFEYTYDNKGRETKAVYKNQNNKKSYQIEHFYDNSLPIKNKLMHDGFNPDTKLTDYLQYLKRSHKNFKIDKISNPKGQFITIDEFNTNNNLIQRTYWLNNGTEYIAKSKQLADKNECFSDTITFDEGETTILTNYG